MGNLAGCIQRPERHRSGSEDSSDGSSSYSSRASSKDSSCDASSSSDGNQSQEARVPFFARLMACMNVQQREEFATAESLKVRSAPRNAKNKVHLVDNTGKVLDDYFKVDRAQILGEGGYAHVLIGKDRRSGKEHAIKCITKKMIASPDRLQHEITINQRLDHPNIAKLYTVFQDPRYVYMVLELCSGGELFDRIQQLGHLSEREAAIIMQQIFRAVHYMHKQNIVHRDLKPENFLFLQKAAIEGNTLKVIDFGIAASLAKETDTLSTRTGTPYYVAPEVLTFPFAQYSKPVDMWSCGVVMYVLLTGRLPFRGADDQATFAKVKAGKVSFPAEIFGNVSEGAKVLIKGLLQKDVHKRYDASKALSDSWTREQAPAAVPAPLQPHVVQAIRVFQAENKLKKVALHVVARQMDERQIRQLRDVFTELDANGDGHLTLVELSEGLKKAELRDVLPADIGELLKHMDTDGSGTVDYTEFLAATLERRQYNNESALWAAFRVFDKNDDGHISKEELREVLANEEVLEVCKNSKVNIEELMSEVDLDGDGFIDFEEFCTMMLGHGVKPQPGSPPAASV